MSDASPAAAPAAGPSFARRLSVDRVALTVNDLDGVRAFYEQIVGLHLLHRDGESAALGAGGEVLLELRRDGAARRRSPREAGLFHTAFLLPTRADLARWLRRTLQARGLLTGASDHDVSEAIYLSDPEGNGIEVYADRPASSRVWADGQVKMATRPLDIERLIATAGEASWSGLPDGSTVGHVHLQVGALDPAEAFYAGVLGLDITCRYPGGTFFAADGYHHHIATNIWNSRGAGPRSFPSTGLAEVAMRVDASRAEAIRHRAGHADGASLSLRDPWGTAILVAPVTVPDDASA
ncbi:VOC family protein [Chelatococcus reniformis]|uniref:Glyoxalase n=1 Tax=Chelatococcus reniformis TaxID=1494448 RepID=A0A916ULL2_9HYPH|nr:VOC family protein [Chelatococcus reniformis]GGC75552.1 glyoxalase [Chelatococcus reniformis]